MRIDKVVLLYDITPAQLKYKSTPAQMQITVARGGMQIESEPMRLDLDNRQFFDSIGIGSNQSQAQDTIRLGKEAAQEASGKYTRQKNAMMGPDSVNISQITAHEGRLPADTQMKVEPVAKPKASWSGGNLNVRFIKDKVEISWKPYELEFTYIPYSVAFRMQKR